MSFSLKIFLCVVISVALSFAIGGYVLISANFRDAEDREIQLALNEHLSLQYTLESAILTQELQGQGVSDDTIRTAAQGIASNLQQDGNAIAIYDNTGSEIYSDAGKQASSIIVSASSHPGQMISTIERVGKNYFLTVTALFTYESQNMYLSLRQDISEIFVQRDAQERTFMLYQGLNILGSSAVAYLVAWILTRPVRQLTQTSHKIAAGDYGRRVEIHSSDEIGKLARSFNLMADSVEMTIGTLEQTARIKDDFIANFSHELKTPMTSIIGYADMLRSRQMDPETAFKAANYIYHEANRLEALSLKMLNLLVLEQQDFTFVPISGPELLKYIVQATLPAFQQSGIRLRVSAQKGYVRGEPDLLKALLLNIVDNARKASSIGSIVDLLGRRDKESYIFTVTDHGRGIPQDELGKITEAFYMVDKSRSRAQNGVGLGLAIASRIAALHASTLQFQSKVGSGTSVSMSLPYVYVQEMEDEE
jgi:signal transduction histidine kinase